MIDSTRQTIAIRCRGDRTFCILMAVDGGPDLRFIRSFFRCIGTDRNQ